MGVPPGQVRIARSDQPCALVFQHGRERRGPIIGREQEAMSQWMESGPWLDAQQKAGWFSRWDGYWLTAHGGDTNAAFQLWGDRAKLDEMRRSDEFEAWMFKISMCMEDLKIVPGVSYSAGAETMARRNKAIGK